MSNDVADREVEAIGQRLRRLRLERGLSQRELSERGVSYAYISRIEAGSRQPSVKALRKLARKLGVSAEYLETGSEIREVDRRELRLANAELELRLDPESDAPERELRAVLEDATRDGDLRSAARARIGLGLAAGSRGRHEEAVQLLESAVAELELRPHERHDVFFALGRSYAARGEPRRAVELFRRCLDETRAAAEDDVPTQVRYATALSYALVDLGDTESARKVVTDALARAGSAPDAYTRIRLYWSIARLEQFGGNLGRALEHARRALALLETTEDTVQLGRAHLLCASLLIESGEAERAEENLAVAERLLGSRPDQLDLAYLRTEQAKRALALGDRDEAERRAHESLEVLGDSDPAEQGSAWSVIGSARALGDDVDGAVEAFRRAAELLERANSPQDAAQVYRAWGRVLRDHGREQEAFDVLDRAAALAGRPLAPLGSE